MNIHLQKAIQVRGSRGVAIDDAVVMECSFPMYINEQLFGTLVASDDQLMELGAGFIITEGLAETVERVEVQQGAIHVLAPVRAGLMRSIGSSSGIELSGRPGIVRSDLKISSSDVYRITREIQSPLWEQTGGVHCSVLFFRGEFAVRSCDVGRHNTLDKVVGYAVLHGLDRSQCVVGCTGRQPEGMVSKVARANIPIIISRAASTDRGIHTAERCGVTLICFSRGDRYTIYSHPERIEHIE